MFGSAAKDPKFGMKEEYIKPWKIPTVMEHLLIYLLAILGRS
jgi:hypothetical protein